MLRRTLSALVATAALSLSVAAQDCSQLAAAVTDNGVTQRVSFDVTGSLPHSLQALVVGQTLGQTTFNLPSATLTLGLAQPFFVVAIGVSDASGDASRSFVRPKGIAMDFNAQSVGVQFVPALSFCTSNVASFSLL